jgi:hypothetical protein
LIDLADLRRFCTVTAVSTFLVAVLVGGARLVLTQPAVRTTPLALELACAVVMIFVGVITLRARRALGGPLTRQRARGAAFGGFAGLVVCFVLIGIALTSKTAHGYATVWAICITGFLCLFPYLGLRKVLSSTK